jgi:hypothetical protein
MSEQPVGLSALNGRGVAFPCEEDRKMLASLENEAATQRVLLRAQMKLD